MSHDLPALSRSAIAWVALLVTAAPRAGDRLYTVAATDPNLRVVDPATAATLSSRLITIPGGPAVQNAKGLALHPLTGELWAILWVSQQRQLAKIDPNTAIATLIGSTGDNFAGIAFDAVGTLYGVTGDGATVPETLFTLNQATGAPTFFMTLGNGNDGETIAHDPLTNQLFHASGLSVVVLETIDLVNRSVTNVPLSGFAWFEAAAMTHWVGRNFLVADIGADLSLVSAAGVVTRIGMMDHNAKGMAFVSTSNAPVFEAYGDGCPAQGGYIPALSGSGTPAWGNAVTLRVINGPGGAPGVFAFGLGTGSVSIAPGCAIQILPLLGFVVPIGLSGTGSGQGIGSMPLQIPPGAGPADIYFQTALIENLSIVLTNPLRMHIQ
jgi:hypothetical protein